MSFSTQRWENGEKGEEGEGEREREVEREIKWGKTGRERR